MPTPKELLQEVWRRAYQEGQVKLTFSTVREARAARSRLYSSVMKIKHTPSLDPSLAMAVESCQVVIRELDNEVHLLIQVAGEDPLLQQAASAIGQSVDHEADAIASADRLRDLLSPKGDSDEN